MFKKKTNKTRMKRPANYNYVFIVISTDFEKVVCRNFTKLKDNPFYGISTEKFDYKLKNIMDQVQFVEYVTDSVTSEMIDGYATAQKELSIF